MIRGEVWWANIPPKRRPVLILTRDAALDRMALVTIMPATTSIRGIPSEIALDEADGLPTACALSADNVQTVPKSALQRRITSLSDAKLEDVCERLSYALGCI